MLLNRNVFFFLIEYVNNILGKVTKFQYANVSIKFSKAHKANRGPIQPPPPPAQIELKRGFVCAFGDLNCTTLTAFFCSSSISDISIPMPAVNN